MRHHWPTVAERPGDRHKRHPLTVRLPEAVAERLERFARSVGLGERVVAKQAITEYLDRHDPETKEQDHGHQA